MLLSLAFALLPSAAFPVPSSDADVLPELYAPANRWALVIGAAEYPHLGSLSYSGSDATAFAATLTERFGFDESTVRLMTDTAEDPFLRPTTGNMFFQLRGILAEEQLEAGDLFVFYFAGHGIGQDGRDYLLPGDGARGTVADIGLDVEQVVGEIVEAGLENVLFVVDGCRTGDGNTFGARLWDLAEEANLAVVLSCAPGQVSNEDARLGGGVFTHHLIEALEDRRGEVIDKASGALWASRVAAKTRDAVRSYTARGFDGEQEPWVWSDPTRDVLLGAELPQPDSELVAMLDQLAAALEADEARLIEAAAEIARLQAAGGMSAELAAAVERESEAVAQYTQALAAQTAAFERVTAAQTASAASFLESAAELGDEPYFHAAGLYADLLYVDERYAACADMLTTARGVTDLGPRQLFLLAQSLQAVNRTAEMTRIQDELIAKFPDSPYALMVLANDMSGETLASTRYEASWRLWTEHPIQTIDLAILIAFNLCNGGASDKALLVVEALAPQLDPATRGGAYVHYVDHLMHGRSPEGLELLEAAESLPPGYPGNWRFRMERFGLLEQSGRLDEVRELLDECVEDWPEDGEWRALRAFFRYERGDWDGALGDATAALELQLQPWSLLLAVRAAGISAPGLREEFAAQAARFPNSWRAGLAVALSTGQSDEAIQMAMDAAKRLAPRLGTWTAEVASIQHDRGSEATMRGMLSPQAFTNLRFDLLDVLAERAGEFGDEPTGWEELCVLATQTGRYRQLAELVHLHLADELEAGALPSGLVGELAKALLNAGDLEGFRAVRRCATPGTDQAKSLVWLELIYLVCLGEDAAARELLAGAPPAPPSAAEAAPWVRALLAARAGELEQLDESTLPPADSAVLQTLAGLTWEALGQLGRTEQHHGPVFSGPAGKAAFFARTACWRSLYRRTDDPEVAAGLAWAAGRDGIGVPLASPLSFAGGPGLPGGFEPSVEDFIGSVEFVLAAGDGELVLPGAEVFLTIRSRGRVNGTLEGAPDADGSAEVWSFSGTIDEHGNLEADLRGAPEAARVFAKLAPPEVFERDPLLAEHGLLVLVLDERARASAWNLALPR
ncbi:MAG: caspase family protein [Planctomycetota bacterium]|nr:caspase family protein [Planctomycetota bacterium]